MSAPTYEDCFDTCAAQCRRSTAPRQGQNFQFKLYASPDEMPDATWREKEAATVARKNATAAAPPTASYSQGGNLALQVQSFK